MKTSYTKTVSYIQQAIAVFITVPSAILPSAHPLFQSLVSPSRLVISVDLVLESARTAYYD